MEIKAVESVNESTLTVDGEQLTFKNRKKILDKLFANEEFIKILKNNFKRNFLDDPFLALDELAVDYHTYKNSLKDNPKAENKNDNWIYEWFVKI